MDQLPLPMARTSDPWTSKAAAEAVAPGNSELVQAIRRAVWRHGALTAFEIADVVERSYPGRWSEATIRTATKRAGLECVGQSTSPRGRPAMLLGVPIESGPEL
jgi:hypothetical protein